MFATPAFAQDGEAEFDGFYIGGSVGYAVQNNDVGETILFDRGSNGSFGETITTGAGANAFSPGFCNGAATSNLNTACTNDKDGIDYHLRLGGDRQPDVDAARRHRHRCRPGGDADPHQQDYLGGQQHRLRQVPRLPRGGHGRLPGRYRLAGGEHRQRQRAPARVGFPD